MIIGFLVERNIYFRIFGPVINQALKAGHQVFCFHNYAQPKTGSKGYQFPLIEQTPDFSSGKAVSLDFCKEDELVDKIIKNKISVIISLDFPERYVSLKRILGEKGVFWAALQNGFDSGIISAKNLGQPDRFFFYSQEWIDWIFSLIGRKTENLLPAGFWLCEKQALPGQREMKERLGIATEKKVVLFLPFPFGSSLKKFWTRYIYGTRFLSQDNDFNLTKAIRKFCDKNDAFLLVKCRKKDPPKRYLEKMADKVLYDESFYPSTTLKCLIASDICFNFYSTAAIEAVSAGVPNVCIAPNIKDWPDIQTPLWQSIFSQERDFFDFPGVSYMKTIKEIISDLPKQKLADFNLDKQKQAFYLQKYANGQTEGASQKIIEEIEKMAEKR